MEKMQATMAMSALAQSTRLDVFLLLVRTLPEGMPSGDLAAATGSSPNTMSAHLAVLTRAGLVVPEKVGRSVVYRAKPARVIELSEFLAHACDGSGTKAN